LSPTQPNTDGTPFFGSPTKLFEYLSMAKPIIASDLDQVAEIIHPAFIPFDLDKLLQITDEVGFVVAPTETQQFIKAACKLVDLPIEDRKKMGENARSKALKNYDWNMHVEKIFLHIQNNKMLKERS
jgi:glycosyltransferase involved in cell wall biosynthesis